MDPSVVLSVTDTLAQQNPGLARRRRAVIRGWTRACVMSAVRRACIWYNASASFLRPSPPSPRRSNLLTAVHAGLLRDGTGPIRECEAMALSL